MTSILCQQCKRPNPVSTTTCIWCGSEIGEFAITWDNDTTSIEAEYLEGIERLEDPGPVRLIINRAGIEIVEMIPGSRSIKIPSDSIINIDVAHLDFRRPKTESSWWRNTLKPFRGESTPSGEPAEQASYLLAITYRTGDVALKGLFRCSDKGERAVARMRERILGKCEVDGNPAEDHLPRR